LPSNSRSSSTPAACHLADVPAKPTQELVVTCPVIAESDGSVSRSHRIGFGLTFSSPSSYEGCCLCSRAGFIVLVVGSAVAKDAPRRKYCLEHRFYELGDFSLPTDGTLVWVDDYVETFLADLGHL